MKSIWVVGVGLAILLVHVENVSAETTFGEQQIVFETESQDIRDVFAADIDGDGDYDILSLTAEAFGRDKIAWHENIDGAGSFSRMKVISTEVHGPRSLYGADADGDGDVDVFSASVYDNKIAWYENTNGEGSFGPQILIDSNAEGAVLVIVKDLDGDGDVDVLSSLQESRTICWYENKDGSGEFVLRSIISDDVSPLDAVGCDDLDGDGDLDIVVRSDFEGDLVWYENTDGCGNYGQMKLIAEDIFRVNDICVVDLDGDDDRDILLADVWATKEVGWLENTDGLGNFGPFSSINTSEEEALDVCAADLDGDGDNDVIVGFQGVNYTKGMIVWQENLDGDGTFGSPNKVTNDLYQAWKIAPCDMDGDGDEDLISALSGNDTIAWHENTDGSGTFATREVKINKLVEPTDIIAADLDGDGDQDVISSSEYDNKIAWYENTDGKGLFLEQKVISELAQNARSVDSADLDGDGDQDVLSASAGDNKIAWYENTDGKGSFGSQRTITTNAMGAFSVCSSDVDGDGDIDVLSASMDDNKIAWYENENGDGEFGISKSITEDLEGACSVLATDIDGDGDKDVLACANGDSKVVWFENTDGEGTFSSESVISSGTTHDVTICMCSILAADMDQDGDQDVVVGLAEDYKGIYWFENTDGKGTFVGPISISDEGLPYFDIAAEDVDMDGDNDIVAVATAAYFEGFAVWSENVDGLGTFGEFQAIDDKIPGARSLYLSDMDGDCVKDVVVALYDYEKIIWYENFCAGVCEDESEDEDEGEEDDDEVASENGCGCDTGKGAVGTSWFLLLLGRSSL